MLAVPRVTDGSEPFDGQHLTLLVIFVLGAVALVVLGRAQRGPAASRPARTTGRVLAVLVCCVTIPSQAFQLTPGDFDLATSLPLQLCDLAWVAAAWGLWTHRRLAVALTYYWGLTLTVQGIITPSLAEAFPHPRFFAFWGMHLLVVWSALYLTLGLGLGPRWRDLRSSVVVTAVWAVLVYIVDVLLEVNYGYLVRKPQSSSALDLLGPWPVYLVVGAALLVGGWALMTWPWNRPQHPSSARSGPRPAHRVAGCEVRTRSSRSARRRGR
jgi:hypothetical integral membrane protein (TIGR02206 family)